MSYTLGGPIVIPKLVDGRNKLFFFANYSFVADLIPGNIQAGAITIPTEAHLRGDFSDLLLLPNPQQYRIYDPLTARPDPNRPGRIIRDPFPNNIIPQNRIVNPAYKQYTQFLPAPNQNPAAGLAPTDNYLGAAEPDQTHSHLWGGRARFQPLAIGPLLLPRRGQLLHRRGRRLDLRESALAGPARDLASTQELVVHRQLDAGLRQRHGRRHAGGIELVSRRRAAPRDEALQADGLRDAAVRRRLLLGTPGRLPDARGELCTAIRTSAATSACIRRCSTSRARSTSHTSGTRTRCGSARTTAATAARSRTSATRLAW